MMHRESHPVSFPVSFQGQRANEDCVRVRPVSHNNVELGYIADVLHGWLGSRVVSVLDSVTQAQNGLGSNRSRDAVG